MGAILTGFLGVVIAVHHSRSGGSSPWIGLGACAICVACFSVAIVWSRVIAQTERAESLTFFSGLMTAIAGLTGMLGYAVPVSIRALMTLLVMGLLCTLGNICIFVALKYTTVAAVSQFHYTQLLFGALVAYFVFGEKPTLSMAIGAVLIIASGLYVAWRVAGANSVDDLRSRPETAQ